MGVPGDSGSCSVGELRRYGKKELQKATVYKRFYPSTTKDKLGELIADIASQDLPKFLEAGTQTGAEVSLVIAAFFYTANVSIQLEPGMLEPFVAGGVKIELVCYPCTDSDEE